MVVAAAEDELERVGSEARRPPPAAARAPRRRRGVEVDARPRRRRPRGRRRRPARRRRRSSRWRRRAAAAGPASYGGSGRRYASTSTRGERKPAARAPPSPPAAHPCRPHSATTSPGRAPERSTGAWAHAPSTVTAITIAVGAGHVTADDAGTDQRRTRRRSPGRSPAPTRPAGRPARPARRSARCARPPIALMSERFCGGRPVTDVRGRRPSPGGSAGARPSGRWRPRTCPVAHPQHRGVVARARPARARPGGTRPHEGGDQPELADVGEGRVRRRWHGHGMPSHQTCRVRMPPSRARAYGDRRPRRRLAARAGDLDVAAPPRDHARSPPMVVQAYILIQTDVGKAADVAEGDRPRQGRHAWPRTSPVRTT